MKRSVCKFPAALGNPKASNALHADMIASNMAELRKLPLHPFALEFLFRITRRAFYIAQYRHVFAGLDEFSRLEDGEILGLTDSSKIFSHFGWISPYAGVGPTLRANLFPINFVGNQLQKRRDISATKSSVCLLYDIECCGHGSYLERVLKGRKGLTPMRYFATVSTNLFLEDR
jgi:hypothetical protein